MGIKLGDLLEADEGIAVYATTSSYIPYHCICSKGSTDVSGMLEETLHRILDAGGTADDVYAIMGAEIPSSGRMEELTEFEEYVLIDLGYVIPGLITSFKEEINE